MIGIDKYKWILQKNALVCFDGEIGVGTIHIPNKGSWCQWVLLATKTPYADTSMGRVNGRKKAQWALIARYELEAAQS